VKLSTFAIIWTKYNRMIDELFNHWRKQLRIRYLGMIEERGVLQFRFLDLETHTNFHVPHLTQLEQTLAVHRQSPNRKGDYR